MNAVDPSWSALIVDDDAGVRQSLRLCLEVGDAASPRVLGVATASGALEALERSSFDVVLLDLWLGADAGLTLLPKILRSQPGIGVIVITAFATFETAVEAIKLGALDYLPKPFTPDQVRHAVRRVIDANRMKHRVSELEARLVETDPDAVFSSKSARFRSFLDAARRAAASECVVLLRGESGTGKNILARFLRAHSPRAQAPFVSVNCPSLSGDMMVSTLFGHRKGAFTGATGDAEGKVQEAEGGTLFLDEIGDLTTDAQARSLRFLNDRSYERLGEAKERRADVRIIAATNRPLEDEVKAGRFREDLLFRMNVVTLVIPPLRERPEDVLPMAEHWLTYFSRRQQKRGRRFSPAAERAIEAYAWPGNLRELRNAVERALILAPREDIEPADLGIHARVEDPVAVALGADVALDDIEREHIARVLARSTTLESAARTLGIDATTLQRKRKRYGLA